MHRSATLAFQAWSNNVWERRSMLAKMRRVTARLGNVKLARCFDNWADFVADAEAGRHTRRRFLRAACFHRWAGFACRSHDQSFDFADTVEKLLNQSLAAPAQPMPVVVPAPLSSSNARLVQALGGHLQPGDTEPPAERSLSHRRSISALTAPSDDALPTPQPHTLRHLAHAGGHEFYNHSGGHARAPTAAAAAAKQPAAAAADGVSSMLHTPPHFAHVGGHVYHN
jgi:hypothetical protein